MKVIVRIQVILFRVVVVEWFVMVLLLLLLLMFKFLFLECCIRMMLIRLSVRRRWMMRIMFFMVVFVWL